VAVPLFGFQALDREAGLAAIRRQIRRLEGELEAASARRESLAQSLERVGVELRLQERRIEESVAALALTEIRVLDTEDEVRRLERELAKKRLELRGHLLTLYSFGKQGYLRLILSMEVDHDIPSAIRQIRFLARRDAMTVEDFETLSASLAAERQRLEDERAALGRLVEEERLRRAVMADTQRRHRALLAEVERRHVALKARSAELRDREARLAELITLLLAQNEEHAFAASKIQDFRGVLDWPVDGEVVIEFGPRTDPRYGTRIPHNGIAISPTDGARVKPIFGGRVLFAAPFEGYGRTVVLSHSGGVLSLYAGLRELQVAKGDVVSLKQSLGLASKDFYFQIRVANAAVDPRGWLR